jgi:hypothetical protein
MIPPVSLLSSECTLCEQILQKHPHRPICTRTKNLKLQLAIFVKTISSEKVELEKFIW